MKQTRYKIVLPKGNVKKLTAEVGTSNVFVRRPLSEAREALINARADELSVSDKALYAQITEAVNTLERKMRSLSEQWLKAKVR